MIGWKRKWSTVNREFCEDGEVVRWRAIGHREMFIYKYVQISQRIILPQATLCRRTLVTTGMIPVVTIGFGGIIQSCHYSHSCHPTPTNKTHTIVGFLRASAMLKHVIDIGWTSVICPSVQPSVRLSVCPSVRHTLVLYQNG